MFASSKENGWRDLILLIDDSGSINDPDFGLLKTFSQSLITRASEDTRIAVVSFHSSATTISSFSKDKKQILNSIEGYSRNRGETNLIAGLSVCEMMFEASLPGVEKVILMVTDGVPSQNPSSKIISLKLSKVTIVALGIGKEINMENLQKYATFGKSYKLENYKDLDKWVSDEEISEMKEKEVQLIITEDICTYFGDVLQLKIVVENSGHMKLLPIEVRCNPPLIKGKSYFHSATASTTNSLLPGEKETITMEFKPTGAPFDIIPLELTFKIFEKVSREEIFCRSDKLELRSDWFTARLINYTPPYPVRTLNVLLFGVVGAGKSSFMNALLTSLNSQKIDAAMVGGSADHCTKHLRKFSVQANCPQYGECKINFIDTWGLDETNYTGDFLLKILAGNVPSEYSMVQAVNGQLESINSIDDRMHSVLLFVPIGILGNDKMRARVKEILGQISQFYINPDIIVTRAASVKEPELLKRQIASEFNIPHYRINLVENYSLNAQKSFEIDKISLNILDNIITKSETYINTYLSEQPILQSPPKKTIPVMKKSPKKSCDNININTNNNDNNNNNNNNNGEYDTLFIHNKTEIFMKMLNVPITLTIEEFEKLLEDEAGESYIVTKTGNQTSLSEVIQYSGQKMIVKVKKPKEVQRKLTVIKSTEKYVLLPPSLDITLSECRKLIEEELELIEFSFLGDGIKVATKQEIKWKISDIVSNSTISIV